MDDLVYTKNTNVPRFGLVASVSWEEEEYSSDEEDESYESEEENDEEGEEEESEEDFGAQQSSDTNENATER